MRARSASTLLRAVMAWSACRVWASVMGGVPIVSSFEQIFHGRGTRGSIEQNFHVLKGTKISFYTVSGSSCSIRRMLTRPAPAGHARAYPRGVYSDEKACATSAIHGGHEPRGPARGGVRPGGARRAAGDVRDRGVGEAGQRAQPRGHAGADAVVRRGVLPAL